MRLDSSSDEFLDGPPVKKRGVACSSCGAIVKGRLARHKKTKKCKDLTEHLQQKAQRRTQQRRERRQRATAAAADVSGVAPPDASPAPTGVSAAPVSTTAGAAAASAAVPESEPDYAVRAAAFFARPQQFCLAKDSVVLTHFFDSVSHLRGRETAQAFVVAVCEVVSYHRLMHWDRRDTLAPTAAELLKLFREATPLLDFTSHLMEYKQEEKVSLYGDAVRALAKHLRHSGILESPQTPGETSMLAAEQRVLEHAISRRPLVSADPVDPLPMQFTQRRGRRQLPWAAVRLPITESHPLFQFRAHLALVKNLKPASIDSYTLAVRRVLGFARKQEGLPVDDVPSAKETFANLSSCSALRSFALVVREAASATGRNMYMGWKACLEFFLTLAPEEHEDLPGHEQLQRAHRLCTEVLNGITARKLNEQPVTRDELDASGQLPTPAEVQRIRNEVSVRVWPILPRAPASPLCFVLAVSGLLRQRHARRAHRLHGPQGAG